MNFSLFDKFDHCFGVGIASDLKAVAVAIKLPIREFKQRRRLRQQKRQSKI